jgi:hypothetical protein
MTAIGIYCAHCEMRHAEYAPHCTVCGLLLAAPAAGQHPACAAMVAQEQRINRPEVPCGDCRSLTRVPDGDDRCPTCVVKALDAAQGVAFRRLEAAGRPRQNPKSATVAATVASPTEQMNDYRDRLDAEVKARAEIRDEVQHDHRHDLDADRPERRDPGDGPAVA